MSAPLAGPAEERGPSGPGLSGSQLFHVALVAGLAPVVSVPLVGLLALVAARRRGEARERRWARRIAGVLIVDELVDWTLPYAQLNLIALAVLLIIVAGLPLLWWRRARATA